MRSIDHLVLAVRDLPAVRLFFQQLGFQTAPLGVHPFGTGNHNVFFDKSFIELLGVLDANKVVPHGSEQFSFSAFNEAFLQKRQGLSMLVVNTDDARADEQRLREAGWHTYPSFHFSRPNQLPDGSKVDVAFTTTFCTHHLLPELAFFVCQHHHPAFIWHTQYQEHELAIQQISALDIVTTDPEVIAPLLQHLFACPLTKPTDSSFGFQTAKERINLLHPDDFNRQYGTSSDWNTVPYFGAITFELRETDWEETALRLRKNNIPYLLTNRELIIQEKDAFGVFLKFKVV